jgi:RND family efflux transporter MFP subunit
MPQGSNSRRWLVVAAIAVVVAVGFFWWRSGAKAEGPAAGARTGGQPVAVTTAIVRQQDLPVLAIANGSVVALQAVDMRPQISSTVQEIHFVEGQSVRKGDLLFTLDARTEEANLRRAEAQVIKSRSDLANAERNLQRQRDLFQQKFISQSALDTAINQYDVLKGQLSVDEAAAEASRVARTFTEIRAPFNGRTGAINVRVGSLVQPQGNVLVTVSQIDPIAVSFALPERELPYVQRAMAKGEVPVTIELQGAQKQLLTGKLTFIESTVDSASGTIAMKAAFANPARQLWPGMFVNVSLSARTLPGALVVPVQAVQSGPERKFVYTVGEGNKATMVPVEVEVIQAGLAAIKGVPAGAKVVVEGAQNVRKDSVVAEGGTGKGAATDAGKDGKSGKPAAADAGAQAAKP